MNVKDKILVVDDNPDAVHLIKKILEKKGYNVIIALSEEECFLKQDDTII